MEGRPEVKAGSSGKRPDPFGALKLTRRRFIKLAGTGVAILPAARLAVAHDGHRPPLMFAQATGGQAPALKALSAAEAEVVKAAAARIIPTDKDPGATEGGAVFYIDDQLSRTPVLLRLYRDGVAQLQRASGRSHGKPFPALSEAQQYALLRAAQAGRINGWKESPRFFTTLRAHTVESFYGFMIGWKTIGFEGESQPTGYMDYGQGKCPA